MLRSDGALPAPALGSCHKLASFATVGDCLLALLCSHLSHRAASCSHHALLSELVLNSSSALVLGALIDLTGARPRLGLQRFGNTASLGLCPRSPDCISTAEEINDADRYVPPWRYNAEEYLARRSKAKESQAEAMAELRSAVESVQQDGYVPKVVEQTADYLRCEYTSDNGLLRLTDDVEWYFPSAAGDRVEYRSSSRSNNPLKSDVNRRRIRAVREALQSKGWRSVGY